jgi:hypothetical protein
MVRAWYMDNDTTSDQRSEHQLDPPQFLDLKTLYERTGVEYFKVFLELIFRELESLKLGFDRIQFNHRIHLYNTL